MAASHRPDERDPFAVLGVPRDCTPETLHRAYRALARRYHPDVNAEAGAAERMRRINAAFVAARRQLHARAAARVSVTVSTARTPPATSAPPSAPAPSSNPAAQSSQGEHDASPGPASKPRTAAAPEGPGTLATSLPTGKPTDREPDAQPAQPHAASSQPLTPSGPAHMSTQGWRAPAAAGDRSLHLGSRALPRRVSWPLRGLAVVVLAAMPVLVLLLFVHEGWLGGARRTTPSNVPDFALGRTTTIRWPGVGSVTLNEHAVARLPAGTYSDPIWSFDGRYLALTEGDPSGRPSQATIVIMDTSGQQVRTFPGFAVRWSPLSDQMAVLVLPAGASVPQLRLADIARGSDRLLEPHVSEHVAWSPDGSMLLFSADSLRGLRLLNLQTSTTTLLYDAPAGDLTHIISLGWFSDNEVLCVQSSGSTTRMVLVNTLTGQLNPLPPTLTSPRQAVAWNATREQVLYVSQAPGQGASEPLLLDRATGTIQALPGLRGMMILAGWSADNQWMAGASVTTGPPGNGQTTLCLLSMPTRLPSGAWTTRCLPIEGTIAGLRWETSGARLTYLRDTGSSTGEELRELTITDTATPAASSSQTQPVPIMALYSAATYSEQPVSEMDNVAGEMPETHCHLPASGHTSCWHSVAARGLGHADLPLVFHSWNNTQCQHATANVSTHDSARLKIKHPVMLLGRAPDAGAYRQQSPAHRPIAGHHAPSGRGWSADRG